MLVKRKKRKRQELVNKLLHSNNLIIQCQKVNTNMAKKSMMRKEMVNKENIQKFQINSNLTRERIMTTIQAKEAFLTIKLWKHKVSILLIHSLPKTKMMWKSSLNMKSTMQKKTRNSDREIFNLNYIHIISIINTYII